MIALRLYTIAVLRWLVNLFLRWCIALDPGLAPVRPDYLATAQMLTEHWEAVLGAGYGEAKRHHCLAGLAKMYPALSKRTLSQAIEDALPDV